MIRAPRPSLRRNLRKELVMPTWESEEVASLRRRRIDQMVRVARR